MHVHVCVCVYIYRHGRMDGRTDGWMEVHRNAQICMHSTSASFMGRNAFSMYVAVHMRMHEPSHAHVGVLFTSADGDDLECVTRRPWLYLYTRGYGLNSTPRLIIRTTNKNRAEARIRTEDDLALFRGNLDRNQAWRCLEGSIYIYILYIYVHIYACIYIM